MDRGKRVGKLVGDRVRDRVFGSVLVHVGCLNIWDRVFNSMKTMRSING